MINFTIASGSKKEIIDITDKISEVAKGKSDGLINIFVKHTTCAITTADLDPGTENDYLNAFQNISPKLSYNHPHNPSHFPDHLLSAMMGTSLSIPVENGKLELGNWQRIILIELDGPREREIVITYHKE